MSSIRCIVAATDFSTFSGRVVQRAARIARQHDAEMHLLHVVRPLDLYPGLTLAPDEFTRHDKDLQQVEQTRLDALAADKHDRHGLGHDVEPAPGVIAEYRQHDQVKHQHPRRLQVLQPAVERGLALAQPHQAYQQHHRIGGDEHGRDLARHVAHEIRIALPPTVHGADIGSTIAHLPAPPGVTNRVK
jgi:nucleotide-binding universal stress UspA family protein